MNVKKITAAVMAAAVLAVAAPVMGMSDPIGVVASAAEEKLLVADVNTVFGNGVGNFSLGGGYFYVKSTGTFYKIGESELDNWRQTGKLTPSVVKNNTGRSFSGVDLFDEYVNNERYIYFSFMETDLEDGFHNFSHVCVLDKAKNTVELLFTTKSWSTDEKFTGTTVSVNEVTSNGIAKLEKRSYSDGKELELWYEWVDLSSNKVIFTWRNDSDPMLQTWISDRFAGYYTYNKDDKSYLCGLLKNGDTEVLEQRVWYNPCEIVDAFDGGLVYGVNRYNEEYTWNGALIVEGRDYFVYLESTGKCYHIDPTIGDYYIHHFEDEFTASVNGNRLICNMYGGGCSGRNQR